MHLVIGAGAQGGGPHIGGAQGGGPQGGGAHIVGPQDGGPQGLGGGGGARMPAIIAAGMPITAPQMFVHIPMHAPQMAKGPGPQDGGPQEGGGHGGGAHDAGGGQAAE
ncbi:MAG TPA: hypothetical protein VMC85_15815 [Desulfomonilaceae bacterium]|nr:hypothetical protein [Desulfomonilaceae bacterium]